MLSFQKQLARRANYIKTSKYQLYSFLPVSLFLQFSSRHANIYFLIVAVLQSMSIITPLNPVTAIAPLALVLGISITREGYEYYQAYRSDQTVNNQT